MNPEAARLIETLDLRPHPEGGFSRETYRSERTVRLADGTARSAVTSISFLLTADRWSTWHRLSSDEIWHFYRGDAVTIEVIDAAGRATRMMLGADGPHHAAIPPGAHVAAHVDAPDGFALVGCDVAPGFTFSDFALSLRALLLAAYPQHAELILRYAR